MANLPAVTPLPVDQVLLMGAIAGWSPYISGSSLEKAIPATKDWAGRPQRLSYSAFFSTPGNLSHINVSITQYPNADWARYEARNPGMPNSLIELRPSFLIFSRLESIVYQDGPRVYWSSGDKLVAMDCGGIRAPGADKFVNAYLKKYPSTILPGSASFIPGPALSISPDLPAREIPLDVTIVSPKTGQIVRPGEIIKADLVPNADTSLFKSIGEVVLMSPQGFSAGASGGLPYSFEVKVPEKEDGPRLLIGMRMLMFGSWPPSRKDYIRAAVDIDVEEPDLPLAFYSGSYTSTGEGPTVTHLDLNEVNDFHEIVLFAKFPNGHKFDVSSSTHISVSSENPDIATVTADHMGPAIDPWTRIVVTATSAGETRIVVTYAIGSHKKVLYVPVSLKGPSNALKASPATINFGDIPAGTTSRSADMTITNTSSTEVRVFSLDSIYFRPTRDNCSDTILPPGGSCAITVAFAPDRAEPIHGYLLVPNSQGPGFIIPMYGNGT